VATGTPSATRPAKPLRFRRSVEKLTAGQLADLRDAFHKSYGISDDRGYQHFAGIHGYPLPWYCAHGTPEFFLPWHRAYLYFFERSLRVQNPNASLAWWDWTSPGSQAHGLPKAFAAAQAGGAANPLHHGDVNQIALDQGQAAGDPKTTPTVRNPGQPGTQPLPTAAWLTDLIDNHSGWVDFSNTLEDAHGAVHVWVGGHMRDIGFAAYDPIFWAHHTMIDRIWHLWQLKWRGGPPANVLDRALPPFPMTVRQTLEIHRLGYDYAASSAAATPSPVT
jgi:tyrosinase